MKIGKYFSFLVVAVIGGLLSSAAQAVDVRITGKIMARPPCKVVDKLNAGSLQITTSFSNSIVQSELVANPAAYKKQINVHISCTANAKTSGMSLLLTPGSSETASNGIINTNLKGLGIQIKDSNGRVYQFNQRVPIDISASADPELYAWLVVQSGVTVPKGSFHASATLNVVYD